MVQPSKVPTPHTFSSREIANYAFSILVVGVTFKQLPTFFGINLVLLLLLALVSVILLLLRREIFNQRVFLLVGTGMVGALLLGGLVRYLSEVREGLSGRDTMAYIYTYYVVCGAIVLGGRNPERLIKATGTVIAVYLLVVTVLACLPSPVQSAMWFYDVKLQGLSDNPNQIAYLAIVGISILAVCETFQQSTTAPALICSAGCAIAGILSGSSAFVVAIFGAGLIFVTSLPFSFSKRFQKAERPVVVTWSRTLAVALVTALAPSLYNAAPKPAISDILPKSTMVSPSGGGASERINGGGVSEHTNGGGVSESANDGGASESTNSGGASVGTAGGRVSEDTERKAPSETLVAEPEAPREAPAISGDALTRVEGSLDRYVHADGGQGSVRLQLWSDAIKLIAESPYLGYGPGQHLQAVGDPKPQEAHNTLLDILLVSGAVGGVYLAAIFGCLAFVVWKTQGYYLASIMLVPLIFFGMFHYIGRQPLTWIMLYYCVNIVKLRQIESR